MAKNNSKQGFPPVPQLENMHLFRFLGGVRSALIEQQALSRFFSSLTRNQQSNLLKALRGLVRDDNKQDKKLHDLEQCCEEGRVKIGQLEEQLAGLQGQLNELANSESGESGTSTGP